MSDNVQSLGVVGAGVMGRSIALCALQNGIPATLFDANSVAGATAAEWIAVRLADGAHHPSLAADLSQLGACDVLVEAVVENRSVKRRVLKALSELTKTALIATNTSSLSIAELAENVHAPSRFCGLHFCHPVVECPLVEVVPGPETADQTVARAAGVVRQMRLQPLVTRDVPGFAVNRLLFPYLEAAVALVRGGVDWLRIEQVAIDFGMRQGPLAQMDEIGIDVILRAAAAFHRGNPVVPAQSELLLAMYGAGRLGRKTGRGFLRYVPGELQGTLDPAAIALAAAHRTEPIDCPDDELERRLFVPMLVAACQLLTGRIVADVGEVLAALRFGLGCRGQAADLPAWGRLWPVAELRRVLRDQGLEPDQALAELLRG